MTSSHDSSAHADGSAATSEAALRRRQQQQRNRIFVPFAIIEGAVLVAAVIAIYVLELIDPAMGIWVILALAMVGSMILSSYLVIGARRDQRELEALRGS